MSVSAHAPAARQRGLSIVESLVGITVGLFIVAAAATIVSAQLASNRRLLLDTQIQQDLRASADIIARELRRSGALRDGIAAATLWQPGMTFTPIDAASSALTPTTGPSDNVTFQYQRTSDVTEYGFKLHDGRIQSKINGEWQDLTDANAMHVTAFAITPRTVTTVTLPCPNLCPTTGDTACWPTVTVREIDLQIDGEAANDASVRRSIRGTVRVRNDAVVPDPLVLTSLCPA